MSAAKAKQAWEITKETATRFLADDCLSMAGALAYFSVFSLPGLLVIVISLSGLVLGEEAARGEIYAQTEEMIGSDAARQLEEMIEAASSTRSQSTAAAVIGILSLVIGATGVFVQLQNALNKVWHVMPDPHSGGVKNFIKKRVLSFGMVAGLGFLLLVSLVISAVVAAMSNMVGGWVGSETTSALVEITHTAASLVVFAALFAAIFKIMPDVYLAWRDVLLGACVTSLIFAVGKAGIGLYVGNSNIASGYGAAGSLVVMLVWIYYSSVMLLGGAVFTFVLFRRGGKQICPENGAMAVLAETREATPEEATASAPGGIV
jgi:membrane protein